MGQRLKGLWQVDRMAGLGIPLNKHVLRWANLLGAQSTASKDDCQLRHKQRKQHTVHGNLCKRSHCLFITHKITAPLCPR